MLIGNRLTMFEENMNINLEENNFYIYPWHEHVIGNLVKDSQSESITIKWGDGTSEVYTQSSISDIGHIYPEKKPYILSISNDVSSFHYGYTTYDLICNLTLGSKLKTIQSQSSQHSEVSNNPNDQQYFMDYLDHMNFMYEATKNIMTSCYATSLGSYGSGMVCANLRYVDLTTFQGVWYYVGGLRRVQNLYFDSPNITIQGNYIKDWSNFFDGCLDFYTEKSIHFTNKTLSEIKSMSYYPWQATDSNINIPITFYGSDGAMDKYGNRIE